MGHTKGPWTIHQDPTELRCDAIGSKFEYEPGEWASVWIAREVARENARLIAAAPEMLEVLETIENDGKQVPAWLWEKIVFVVALAGGKVKV